MTCWSYDYKGVFKGWSYIHIYVKLLELRAHHVSVTVAIAISTGTNLRQM